MSKFEFESECNIPEAYRVIVIECHNHCTQLRTNYILSPKSTIVSHHSKKVMKLKSYNSKIHPIGENP